jgi:hypothetical protein
MIFDSAVHAYGRVARVAVVAQLLLPVFLAYMLLPGQRHIPVAIVAHCRRPI